MHSAATMIHPLNTVAGIPATIFFRENREFRILYSCIRWKYRELGTKPLFGRRTVCSGVSYITPAVRASFARKRAKKFYTHFEYIHDMQERWERFTDAPPAGLPANRSVGSIAIHRFRCRATLQFFQTDRTSGFLRA